MIHEQKGIKLPDGMESRIAEWLSTEIHNTRIARGELEDIWAEINEMYDETELKGKKNFPFENAAHLVIPVLPMMVETAKSKVFSTIFAPKDPLTPTSLRPEFSPFEKPLRRFLTWAAKHELKLNDRLDPIILEMFKLGTAVGKAVYTKEYKNQMVWNAALDDFEDRVYILKDSPEIVHPALEDILFPLDATDDTLNEVAWISERFRVGRNTFKSWAKSKSFDKDKIEKIRAWEDDRYNEVEESRTQAGEKATYRHSVELEEVWFDHVLDDDSPELYRLCGYLHLPTRTFLKLTHSWFPYGLHPYEICQLERREHKVYGNGFGQIGRVYQQEISTQHNQRLDAMTIANANVFKRKADSMIPESLVFRPGASIPVDDMDDLQPLFSGQKYDSTIQEEQNTLALLRERVGLQEYAPDVLASAQTGSLALALGESTRRFDQVVGRVRGFIARLMMKIMLLYQKYYPEGKSIMLQGEEGQAMAIYTAQFPEEFIYNGMAIEVTATTSVTSAELDRQHKMTLFNMLTQTYGQVTQYLMQAANPQLPQPVRLSILAFVDGLLDYVGDVIEDYNLSNTREIGAVTTQVKEAVESIRQEVMGGVPGGQPGMGGVPGGAGQPVPQGPA